MYSQWLTLLLWVGIAIIGLQASPNSDPHFVADRSVIVHLMEWTYAEVATECEQFLGPHGFGGVQLSPVHECAVIDRRPWWERYQPVSYKIDCRSGNETSFADMTRRCNKAGVRIYVDVVLNHMTGVQSGKGTAGDPYDGVGENYSAAGFTSADFHGKDVCHTADLNIKDYDDPQQARNCQLGGLRDLNQGRENVRKAQAQFLNKLIKHGVAGFRSDASKHQWPEDLKNIISRLDPLNTEYFPANAKPFIYHEYISGTRIKAQEYTPLGRVIEFKAFDNLGHVFRKKDNQKLAYFKNWGVGWGMLPSDDALIMVDSHDLQRGQSGNLAITITYFEPRLLKMATAFMLAQPYAVTRVMSSYYWPRTIQGGHDINDWMGPPHDSAFNIAPVKRMPDLSCNASEWICEHRWRQIYNMVGFRNAAGAEPVANWWDNGNNSVAFGRGNKAFIAINNDVQPIDAKLKTGLPAGNYCDII
ncbi:unnamed protein product [Medioppia subpectinata]|uniref:Alpha-amylase n=1 Tax=Medioppia subpectinata TaxID=1979941 RepID=A0A7R9QB08_9ACAR|nr:unnamed protein product [Medioppia subpectinata]CAG2117628.1 unnamed protein product [Medioppia subpectinata]